MVGLVRGLVGVYCGLRGCCTAWTCVTGPCGTPSSNASPQCTRSRRHPITHQWSAHPHSPQRPCPPGAHHWPAVAHHLSWPVRAGHAICVLDVLVAGQGHGCLLGVVKLLDCDLVGGPECWEVLCCGQATAVRGGGAGRGCKHVEVCCVGGANGYGSRPPTPFLLLPLETLPQVTPSCIMHCPSPHCEPVLALLPPSPATHFFAASMFIFVKSSVGFPSGRASGLGLDLCSFQTIVTAAQEQEYNSMVRGQLCSRDLPVCWHHVCVLLALPTHPSLMNRNMP